MTEIRADYLRRTTILEMKEDVSRPTAQVEYAGILAL
jgi:hypothetical protein